MGRASADAEKPPMLMVDVSIHDKGGCKPVRTPVRTIVNTVESRCIHPVVVAQGFMVGQRHFEDTIVVYRLRRGPRCQCHRLSTEVNWE